MLQTLMRIHNMQINEIDELAPIAIPKRNVTALAGYNNKDPMHSSWSRVASRQKFEAGRRGISFTVTMEYLWELLNKQEWKCALSGAPFTISGTRSPTQPSLDRINPAAGYEPGNVQYVTYRVNLAKRELTDPEFIMLCKQVASYS